MNEARQTIKIAFRVQTHAIPLLLFTSRQPSINMRAEVVMMMNPRVHSLVYVIIGVWSRTLLSAFSEMAARVDSRPRWQPPALTAARDVCPIRKRALGVPSARVKFLAPRRVKNRPLFLKKGKLGKNIVFLEVKNATMSACGYVYVSHL